MPYIAQDKRTEIDAHLTPFIENVKTLPLEEQDGAFGTPPLGREDYSASGTRVHILAHGV